MMTVLIPLRHRVPNPPACFTGRARERRWLARAVATGPLTLVCGPSGRGKSALVHAVFERELGERRERTVAVSMRGAEPGEHVAFTLLRALVDSTGPLALDWSELLRTPETITALALDVAEEHELTIALDDLDDVEPALLEELVRALGRYARRSRWVLSLREAPRDGALERRTLALGPLPEPSLLAIARALRPEIARRAALEHARAAEGSAWRLLRRVHFGAGASEPSSLDDATRATLRALGCIELPVSDELARRLAPEGNVELDRLVDGGLLERLPAGLRVPSAIREQLAGSREPSMEWRVAAAALLAGEPSAAAKLEAMRLVRTDPLRVSSFAMSFGEALVAEGYAPALDAILGAHDDVALDELRLRVALELGDRASLARVRAPRSRSLAAQALWAEVALVRGEFDEGLARAEAVVALAAEAGDAEALFDARLRAAKFTANLGRLDESLAALQTLAAPDPASRARRDSFASNVASLLGNVELAYELACSARGGLDALPWPERAFASARVARTFYNVVRYEDAAIVVDALQDDPRLSVRFHTGRTVRFLRACLALDRGDLESARADLASLEPYLGTSPLLFHARIARASIAAAAGDLEAHAEACAALEPGVAATGVAEVRRAVLAGRLLRRERDASAVAGAASLFDRLGRWLELRVELHVGARSARATLEHLGAAPTHPEERVAVSVLRAEALLCLGELPEAHREIVTALRDARERSMGLLEAEATAVECDVLAARGEPAALAQARQRLARHARALPSPRLEGLALLHGPLDGALLERLAVARATMPEAALRARALLDRRVVPGVVDAVVVAARRREGWVTPFGVDDRAEDLEQWRPRWGWSPRTRTAWLPDGRVVAFDAVPLLAKLLDALVLAGGRASKEELAIGVWGERTYHPLRHDNRLQAAVRKLRRRLEDDPASPARLATTDEGYALRDARVAWEG